jgi:hypothetical protein
MGPNVLLSRVAAEIVEKIVMMLSICMGSTSADFSGENNQMLKNFLIVTRIF